ncbi:MAG: hypothetical protein AAFQ88_07855 [Pseudomonadota bacterium]
MRRRPRAGGPRRHRSRTGAGRSPARRGPGRARRCHGRPRNLRPPRRCRHDPPVALRRSGAGGEGRRDPGARRAGRSRVHPHADHPGRGPRRGSGRLGRRPRRLGRLARRAGRRHRSAGDPGRPGGHRHAAARPGR